MNLVRKLLGVYKGARPTEPSLAADLQRSIDEEDLDLEAMAIMESEELAVARFWGLHGEDFADSQSD